MLWAVATMRRHEVTELLIVEQGVNALQQPFEPGGELANHWEKNTNHIVLFLVLALPMAFSPTIAAHLFYAGVSSAYELWLPLGCFLATAVFHVWGTILLVNLYNQHLETEAHYANGFKPTKASSGLTSTTKATVETDSAQPERELVAIMLTDMYGYSKQMEKNEAHAYTKLLEHNQIIRSAISDYRGREIKTIGDAFLVVFRSAIDAVDCALTIQRSFADYNLNRTEAEKILVRIGIHLGDVLIAENDVYGDGVNVAARIEPLAEPGGICLSEPVFEMVRKKIQLEVHKIEGSHLKNIQIAPNIYKIDLSH
jgi:class 3 adenylate cyclase